MTVHLLHSVLGWYHTHTPTLVIIPAVAHVPPAPTTSTHSELLVRLILDRLQARRAAAIRR